MNEQITLPIVQYYAREIFSPRMTRELPNIGHPEVLIDQTLEGLVMTIHSMLIGNDDQTNTVTAHAHYSYPTPTRANLLRAWLKADLENSWLLKGLAHRIRVELTYESKSATESQTYSTRLCPHLLTDRPGTHVEFLLPDHGVWRATAP